MTYLYFFPLKFFQKLVYFVDFIEVAELIDLYYDLISLSLIFSSNIYCLLPSTFFEIDYLVVFF
jgi:hypothetical protein